MRIDVVDGTPMAVDPDDDDSEPRPATVAEQNAAILQALRDLGAV